MTFFVDDDVTDVFHSFSNEKCQTTASDANVKDWRHYFTALKI